jgi:hypothetical protein
MSSLLAALLLGIAWASPAAADLCPPVPVTNGTCKCTVHNYGSKDDADITITLYDSEGTVLETCGPFTLAPNSNIACTFLIPSGSDRCACTVTGESGKTLTSLSSESGAGVTSVPCR